ncbi:hypothetical protein PINS_up001583 [Pythium insidiosum]|nr:hypothetical protein PINS_up001583 [Pythium insidiosum]
MRPTLDVYFQHQAPAAAFSQQQPPHPHPHPHAHPHSQPHHHPSQPQQPQMASYLPAGAVSHSTSPPHVIGGMPHQQGYYAVPSHHHHQHHHQQQQQHYHYQHFSSTPDAIATAAPLKRKMAQTYGHGPAQLPPSSAVAAVGSRGHTSPPPVASSDTLCDVCHHPDPILYSTPCQHVFHSRCVHVWPLSQCPVCDVDCDRLGVLPINMAEAVETRSGKWTRAEEKFIEIILQEFDRCSFPLANGTPVRLVLARLLNCSTMRLSKKFQKNALGKRTFRIPKPTKGVVAMEFNREDHETRQKEFSRLESVFRYELVEQFRRENNTLEGAYVETHNLRKAVKQFWVLNFLKFAVVVGQSVEGLDVSDAKKKKLALQLLRDSRVDELLGWSRPAYASAEQFGLPTTNNEVEQLASTHDPAASVHWSSSGYHPAEPSSMNQVDEFMPQPKKQRTPESIARLQGHREFPGCSLDLSPPAPTQGYEGYPTSRGDDYMQQSFGQTAVYPQTSYGSYLDAKDEKAFEPMAHSPHQQHQQVLPHPYVDARGMARQTHTPDPAHYRGSSMVSEQLPYRGLPEGPSSAAPTGQASYPWDGLLEAIAETTAAPSTVTTSSTSTRSGAPTSSPMLDPSLQAWSNLHIM